MDLILKGRTHALQCRSLNNFGRDQARNADRYDLIVIAVEDKSWYGIAASRPYDPTAHAFRGARRMDRTSFRAENAEIVARLSAARTKAKLTQ